MAAPLDGLRVIDCSRGTAGPRLTWLLADYGADVIWVEPPGGDPYRDDLAVQYSVLCRNKRSVEIDLQTANGRAQLDELLATADVFVESWSPGVAERLGLTYEQVHDRFPELVCCSISGFGPGRPDSDVPGYEPLVTAAVGAMSAVGHRQGPIFLGLPTASAGAAYQGAIGVLSALLRREDDGWGRKVETSLLDGMVAYLAQGWGYSDTSVPMRLLSATPARYVARTFQCADDEWIGVCTFGLGAFDRLMDVLGLADRFGNSGSAIGTALTQEESAVVYEELPRIFATQPRKYWVDLLMDADVAAIECLRACEVFDAPQTVHNKAIVTVDDPTFGPVEQAGPATRFRATPTTPPRPMPTPGQHTDEVLAEARTLTRPPRTRTATPDDRPLLDGVRILDLGHWYAGPYSSRLLADHGADVIKLEPPNGDLMRTFERPFAAAQAGKRSVAADLKAPALSGLRDYLLQWADIVQHNLRPGVMERLGLGYEDVRAANPHAIYLNAPGWGSTGPHTLRQSFAPLMSGYVGAGYEIGGQFNPPLFPMANEDTGAGMLGAVSLLIALVNRRRSSGDGQYVELPQLNSTITDVAHIIRLANGTVLGAERLDVLQTGTGPLSRLYETADGWVCIVVTSDEELRALGDVLAVRLLDEPSFASPEARAENSYQLEAVLTDAFASRQTAGLVAELRVAGVPAVEPVLDNNRDFMDDPLNSELGRVAKLDHPRFGHVKEVAVMVRVGDVRTPKHRRAPELGEHTDEVLTAAGYSAADIAALHLDDLVR